MEIQKVESPRAAERTAALAREIWTEHYEPIIGRDQAAYMVDTFQSADAILSGIAKQGYEYYLAQEDGVPAGYLAIRPEPEEHALFLSKIYVKKEFRRRGLARRFLTLAQRRARETGCTLLWLTVNRNNEGSIAAYRRMGFSVACTMVTDIGNGYVMDDYKMTRPVSDA